MIFRAKQCARTLCLLCLLCLAVSLSGRPGQAGEVDDPTLIAVQLMGDAEEIDWDRVAGGDIHDSVSLRLFGGTMQDLTFFLLWPQESVTVEICRVGDFAAGQPIPGEVVGAGKAVLPGESYIFSHVIPEGMPNLLVCARTESKRLCWAPAFSGVDGSLMFSPGFVPYVKK